MATTSNASAYRRLTPFGDGVTEDIKYWNQDGFRRRQEERINDETAYQRQKDKDDEKKANWDKYLKPLQNFDTQSQSLNEAHAFALKTAEDEILKQVTILNDDKASDIDKTRAKVRLGNLQKTPENLKTFTDYITNEYSTYQDELKKGNVWQNENYESKFKDGFKSVRIGFDDQGKPIIGFADLDGDGKSDFKDVVDYNQIQTLKPTSDFMRKANLSTMASELAKTIGEEDVTTTSGGYKSTQEKQAKKEDLKRAVSDLIIDKEGNLTDTGKSGLREMGLDFNNPQTEDIDQLITKVYQDALGQTDYLKKDVHKPYPVRSSSSKAAAKPKFGQNVAPSEKTWKGEYQNLDRANYNSVPVTGAKIQALEVGDGRTLTDASVVNYTYDKSNNLVIDVAYQDTKSSKYSQNEIAQMMATVEAMDEGPAKKQLELEIDNSTKGAQNKKEVIVVSNEDEAMIAQQLGMSIDEMRQAASKNGSETSETTNQGIGAKYNK